MSNASELVKAKRKNHIHLIVAVFGIVVAAVFAGLFFYSQRPSAIRNFENPYHLFIPGQETIAPVS